MMKLLPKEVTDTARSMADFAERITGKPYDPEQIARPKKGIRKSRFGWVTKEEYEQLQQKEHDDWKQRMINRFTDNGHQDTQGEASVDAATED